MFKRFTSILNQAVDAIAPTLTLHEDFQHHWQSITSYFLENKDEKVPIEETDLISHMEQMLEILVQEEQGSELGSTGSCMEYLLQHSILDTLYALARTDSPPGMKQEVLIFFTKLLNRIHQPLLPHINVHKAVYRLIRLCGEIKASPSENQEIHFLCTVCAKIKADPYLVNFFLESPNICEQQSNRNAQSTDQNFYLIKSLLSLTHSADGRVAVKACEGLMLCASLPEDKCAQYIVDHTKMCQEIASYIVTLHNNLPKELKSCDIEFTDAKWGLDHVSESDDMTLFPGKRQLMSYLSWLDFCDQLAQVSYPLVAKYLSSAIRKQYLEDTLRNMLLDTCEMDLLVATAILNKCLRCVSSRHLLHEFVTFILGEAIGPEKDGSVGHELRHTLLERCNHISDEVSIATIKLFDGLLQKPDESILHNLVLRNLLGRMYLDNDTPSNDDVDDGPMVNGHLSPTEAGYFFSEQNLMPDCLSDSANKVPIHTIVNCFLSLVPESAKSSVGDSGCDTYLHDAHEQFSDVQLLCESRHWPHNAVVDSSYVEEPFFEGAFLKMLFGKLSNILHQSYEINLQVTSIVSKLAILPHPNLHEYLMYPQLCVKPRNHTLYRTLQKIIADLEAIAESSPGFQRDIVNVRQNLLGQCVNTSPPNSTLCEGVIVLEEFCKELAAIAFVKYHALN